MKKSIKIAVAGTHSTGKSTFIRTLKAALDDQCLNVSTIGDSATNAQDLGFPILEQHNFGSTAWIIAQCMSLEAQAELTADVILVDRPVADALGYLSAALRHTKRELQTDRYERLETICRAWIGEYDLIFVSELDETVPIGPGRPDNPIFRVEAAEEVSQVLTDMAPNTITLKYGDMETAIEHCVKFINEENV